MAAVRIVRWTQVTQIQKGALRANKERTNWKLEAFVGKFIYACLFAMSIAPGDEARVSVLEPLVCGSSPEVLNLHQSKDSAGIEIFPIPSMAKVCAGSILANLAFSPMINRSLKGERRLLNGAGLMSPGWRFLTAYFTFHQSWACTKGSFQSHHCGHPRKHFLKGLRGPTYKVHSLLNKVGHP